MRYQGSEAYRLDQADQERERRQARPRLSVVEGGGLDAQARRGVEAGFIARVRAVVAIAVVLVALGAARVALCSATVSCLSQNMALRSQIDDVEATVGDLKVERAQLSSSDRIDRIATQNYGMARATATDHISLDGSDAGSGDAGQQGQAASADGAQTSGAGASEACEG